MVLEATAPDGYGGAIDLIVGVDTDGRVLGVRAVPPHNETPGLGDKIERRKSDWITTFNGRSLTNPDDAGWAVKKDGGSFDSFTEAGEEAGQSRIYGGIHWQYDNTEALKAGRALAEYIFFNFLQPNDLAPDTCTADGDTLCLQGGRFAAEVRWKAADGRMGMGNAVVLGDDSGYFWFFNEENPELTVKVLDACSSRDRFWVFASGLTNVEVTLTVADTLSGEVQQYFNPQGQKLEAVQDTAAFATCP